MGTERQILLRVSGLSVRYGNGPGATHALWHTSLAIDEGECVGLLGESGCGKSTLALALLGLLPAGAHSEGRVFFRGQDLSSLGANQLQTLRGAQIALVAQDPAQALNPALTIGTQVLEVLRSHCCLSQIERKRRTIEALGNVGFTNPETIARRYAHQLSGGEKQRAAIAQAIACGPALLIADEATSKLDPRLKIELLELFKSLRAKYGMALLLITHEPSVVASYCQRLLVMYAGEIVEAGARESLLRQPLHPYSQALVELARQRSLQRGFHKATRFATIAGEPPAQTGANRCFFQGRCTQQMPDCAVRHPAPTLHSGHEVLCLKYD